MFEQIREIWSGWWFQPLWKILVSWDDDIPNIWKVIKFHGSNPPTSDHYAMIWFNMFIMVKCCTGSLPCMTRVFWVPEGWELWSRWGNQPLYLKSPSLLVTHSSPVFLSYFGILGNESPSFNAKKPRLFTSCQVQNRCYPSHHWNMKISQPWKIRK
jgi:hypothetical protein